LSFQFDTFVTTASKCRCICIPVEMKLENAHIHGTIFGQLWVTQKCTWMLMKGDKREIIGLIRP